VSLWDSMFLQVVNRGGRVSDYVHPQTDTKAATGSKRFRRERVGGAADSSLFTNKRCVLFCFLVN
jgi:hypothetical protein